MGAGVVLHKVVFDHLFSWRSTKSAKHNLLFVHFGCCNIQCMVKGYLLHFWRNHSLQKDCGFSILDLKHSSDTSWDYLALQLIALRTFS